ncbi:MAG TPA: multidrug transporter, partial [Dokdonella sp.]
LLERFPRHRGAVSSLQAFVSLVVSALIAGVASPLLSVSAARLGAGAAASTLLGFVAWRAYGRIERAAPAG